MFLRGLCGRKASLVRFSHSTIPNTKKVQDISEANVGETVRIKGWVQNIRSMKKIYFLDVHDGSSHKHLQVLITREKKKELPTLGYGASVIAAGKIGVAPKGNLELLADEFQMIGDAHGEEYPFERKHEHAPEYVRDYMHLRADIGEFRSMLRVRHAATHAVHRYFDRNRFTCIHAPILTSNSCEGAGELFAVTPASTELLQSMRRPKQPDDEIYFNRKTYLTLSAQLHLEAMCHGMGSVYSFGPAFRSENSTSTIHMSEFYMIEAEESFVNGIEDITKRIDNFIRTVTIELLDKHAAEIDAASSKDFKSDEDRFAWLQKPFPVITNAEAIEILTKHADQLTSPVRESMDLAREHELFLVKHIGAPVFVINWPTALKPFYMRRCKHNANLVEGVDFLMPRVGELAGGSVREDSIDILKPNIPNDLKWYLDLRKFGGCTTGGFGVGFDRYLQILLGIQSIKDCIPFPRWPRSCAL